MGEDGVEMLWMEVLSAPKSVVRTLSVASARVGGYPAPMRGGQGDVM